LVRGSKIPETKFEAKRDFSVLGPRFTLNPQDIQEMFPPPGSLGEHSNVLPHIILKRSTLPWERQAQKNNTSVPWLALLLFEEPELPVADQKISTLGELKDARPEPEEKGEHDGDQVTVIDVNRDLLKQLIPTFDELKYLAHVRQTEDPNPKVPKQEVAVVIGNRLPTPGKMSIVHLVSLENRYSAAGQFDYKYVGSNDKIPLVSLKSWRFACVSAKQSFKGLLTHLNHQLLFHFPPKVTDGLITALKEGRIPYEVRSAFDQGARPLNPNVKTVSEHSEWRITDKGNRYYLVSNKNNVFNQAGKKLFDSLKLDANPAEHLPEIRQRFERENHKLDPAARLENHGQPDHWWIEDGHNHYFISQENNALYVYDLDPDRSSTLRLPPSANKQVEEYLKRGCVPLPHATRHGKQTVSWYHGPLIPGSNNPMTPGSKKTSADVELPIQSADELLRYDNQVGMLDVSYAAAWELGRLLTLQKTQVAVDLFNWKRTHVQELHVQEAHETDPLLTHLPHDKAKTNLAPPQTVREWFANLACLRGVPFSYLVPDERMLPLESIRFFRVDRPWIECLLDGAFSIGRVVSKDRERGGKHVKVDKNCKSLVQPEHHIVTGFLLRSDVVSGWPGLLVDGYDKDDTDTVKPLPPLCLPERLSKNVLLCLFDVEVRAVDIHQKPETLHFGFNRPEPGSDFLYKEKTGTKRIIIKDKRVVDIGKLAGAEYLASGHSAQFASDMIEGVERVQFAKRNGQLAKATVTITASAPVDEVAAPVLAQAQAATTHPTLKLGDRGEAVKQLQRLLGMTEVDGDFGAATKRAVENAQQAARMAADGIVGPNTWELLESRRRAHSHPTLRRGASGEAVRQLQRLLGVKEDGDFGAATDEAVRKAQKAAGAADDGIVGPHTWELLESHRRSNPGA
jgi:peptidoglycan hydrolase-like protein with peptidoglycan-binding domain